MDPGHMDTLLRCVHRRHGFYFRLQFVVFQTQNGYTLSFEYCIK